MSRNLTAQLAAWIASGARKIGQIQITPLPGDAYELRHQDDAALPPDTLACSEGPEAARSLALSTESGEFRPLKTAPNLRRGWRLRLHSAADLRIALDHFYPAMAALCASHLENALRPVPLRETLGRQTGMYAATKRVQDEEAQTLVASACSLSSRCLKRILWPLSPEQPLSLLPPEKFAPAPSTADPALTGEIPLLCHEACNLLVAATREVVKKRERAASAAAS
ncbi:MAG: hypothetical protein RLZZ142_2007 [Verrucomicrobiota bacterium]|jgi:sirohydrochlorin cobaltochelatase